MTDLRFRQLINEAATESATGSLLGWLRFPDASLRLDEYLTRLVMIGTHEVIPTIPPSALPT